MSEPLPFYLRSADPPAKRAILTAALDLFAEHGVDGVTIRDVGARAGYTNPALFRHFASKDALALALFDSCYRHIGNRVAAPGPDGFHPRLLAMIDRMLALIDEAPAAVLFVQDNLRRFWPQLPPDATRLSLFGQLRDLIRAGLASGKVAPGDPALLAGAIIGIIAQTARLLVAGELAGPAQARSAEIARLVTAMLRG